MDLTQVPSIDEAELRAWDWQAELGRQERSLAWLARRTQRSQSALYKFAKGQLTPSVGWLRQAAIALNVTVPQ